MQSAAGLTFNEGSKVDLPILNSKSDTFVSQDVR